MDFRGAKAELDNGLIYMMAGGTAIHAMVCGNIYVALRTRLRGTGCRPYGPDLLVKTGADTARLPDVSVYCGSPADPANDLKQLLGDPVMVIEVLSPSTASHDQVVKLREYTAMAGMRDILFVDPNMQRIRHVRRVGTSDWADDWLPAEADVVLASLGITLPHEEVFSRD